ncbi:hypothetical protein CKO_03596 [Citrobacter koseri ATCC BAA-895]|uniref:Uncharacterized protein n=1 Tax=Citrobacter koseri (strain ATCC BAA-895 / CDC 4225-83 / SGSC4696) TaxID=290338 RepID=A8AMG2_CITK8|nr:hypothetical protein CKO_03596 [Citrobacter koseri ATCC BAA-895]
MPGGAALTGPTICRPDRTHCVAIRQYQMHQAVGRIRRIASPSGNTKCTRL